MLWFDRVGVGFTILVTVGSGLIYYQTRDSALADRDKIIAQNVECSHSKPLQPSLNDDEFAAAFICSGQKETPPPIPTIQNGIQNWLSVMAWVCELPPVRLTPA